MLMYSMTFRELTMLIFSYQLVNPAGDHDNHNGADRRCHNDWQQLRLYDIEVEHKRHAWRNKENPRFLTRKFAIPSTHLRRIHLSCRHAVSSSIPMMLDGNLMPVSHTISSPIARKPKMIPH